jgi:speckle-type POZ protein
VTGGGARREEEAAAAVVLAQDLLRAADRYGLRGLKSLTESELCRHHVAVDTVLPMLALAEHHQCWKLKHKCLEFIASGTNARAVMAATDDVEHLARSCPSVVKELVKILEAKEATPSRRPLMDSADALSFFFLALAFILACVLPLGMWGFFEQK